MLFVRHDPAPTLPANRLTPPAAGALRRCLLLAVIGLALAGTWSGVQAAGPVTVLHSFSTTGSGGYDPQGGVIFGNDGSLYGTARNGSTDSPEGTIYRITTAGNFTLLHAFASDGTEGGLPSAGLLLGQDGNFYGATGAKFFQVTPDGTLMVLHDFTTDYATAGADLEAALIEDGQGNFFGTSYQGGAYGYGAVFEYVPGSSTATALYAFSTKDSQYHNSDGAGPLAPVLLANDGNFYGTATYGGTYGDGTVFRLTPAGVFTNLHSFSYTGGDGANPMAGLIQASDGNLYGTTQYGSSSGSGNPGTVFRVTPAGVVSTVHDFTQAEGSYLLAALTEGTDGFLYGTASQGGAYGNGTVFRMTKDGVVTVLHNFTGSDGGDPASKLVLGADGYFYGTTLQGGTTNNGTVYRLDPTALAGSIQFSSTVYGVSEGAGSVAVTVRRVGGTAGAVSASYVTADGTAQFGTDYVGIANGVVQWDDGDGADKTVSVSILDPKVYDGGTRTFSLTLSMPSGDASLGSPASASVNILDDDEEAPQPTATIASPPDGLTVVTGADLPLAASVNDPGGILSAVQFTINGVEVANLLSPFVYTAEAPASPGDYVVALNVSDTQGRTSTSSVTLHVIDASVGSAPPTTALLTPADNHNLAAGSSVTLSVGATADATTALDHVSLYADGVLVTTFNADGSTRGANGGQPVHRDAVAGVKNVFQTKFTLPSADKLVNMITVALDKLGQSTVSKVASIHATATGGQPPSVALGGLPDGAHVKVGSANAITVTASAPATNAIIGPGKTRRDAASTLALLEYYLNGTKLAQATQPPFSFNFIPPASGKYVLDAVATDSTGLSAITDPVTVQADVVAPTVNLALGGTGGAVEGGANGIIVVTRTGDTSLPLTVLYKTKGAAQAGVDYKKLPGAVTIPAGAVKAKIKVKPIDGSPNASTLKIKLQLLPSTDGGYVVGTGTVKLKLIGH